MNTTNALSWLNKWLWDMQKYYKQSKVYPCTPSCPKQDNGNVVHFEHFVQLELFVGYIQASR